MLSKHFTALAAFATGAVLAANQTGPYHIHITGKTDKSIDGYGASYHAGAAIEALVYVAGPANGTSQEYYYDYLSYDPATGEVYQPGYIVWQLPLVGSNETTYVPEALTIESETNWASNVAPAMFYPGNASGAAVSFYDEGADANHSVYLTGRDDSGYTEARPEQGPGPIVDATNWHLCYQYVGGGYWYNTVSWVFSLPPSNPTCRPVNLALELI
ncbi:hypothetical protein PG993_009901 [Apiospora rasikravindrae]|uniref:Uncharacterized protein n=1 Tax=Apiospora rasikravindrae TaxID=990691 RepID=A0ABR1SKQ0_9PEZI